MGSKASRLEFLDFFKWGFVKNCGIYLQTQSLWYERKVEQAPVAVDMESMEKCWKL